MSGSLVVQACCAELTMQGLVLSKGLLIICRLHPALMGGFLVFFILFFSRPSGSSRRAPWSTRYLLHI